MRPWVKSNENDAKDAEAICEAVARPSMRFVAVKSQAQQDVPALHRVRSLLIRERTALMNQMRGLLAECGIIVAQGAEARTHQPDFVPQLRDLACPVVCSTARFHSHQTGLELRYEAQQLSAPKLSLKSSPALRVDTVNPKQILCQIDTKRSNLHSRTLPRASL